MTPASLDELAEHMLAPAAALIVAVHDHDAPAAHATLDALGVMDLRDLCIALAALVPDDETLSTLLAWTRGIAPISDRQAAANRERLEATLAAHAASRRSRGRAA